MKDLIITNDELTMSSLEVAELTGKRHDHVLADIRKMLLEIQSPEKLGDYKDSKGRTYPMLLLNKEEALCLVAGYNVKMRMAIIKRWQELESQNALRLPNFNDPVEAARAWADQVEANQIAQKQLEAAKPAVEFVDKYVDAGKLVSFRQVCKLLKVKENDFRAFLKDNKIMYMLNGNWTVYANHLDSKRFEMKTGVTEAGIAYSAPYFTTKGVEWIAGLWGSNKVKDTITSDLFD